MKYKIQNRFTADIDFFLLKSIFCRKKFHHQSEGRSAPEFEIFKNIYSILEFA